MNLKFFAGTIALVSLGAAAKAQDKIYLRSGDVLEAKVKEVDNRVVVYKKYSNQDGPDYKIGRNEIEYIRYENGSEDRFSRSREDREEAREARSNRSGNRPAVNYGDNIISLAVVQMTNESPAGFGLHYERVLDKRGIISLYLPVAFSIVHEDFHNNSYYYDDDQTDVFFYAYPGVKIYPTGSKRRISYGVGPSLALGWGRRDVYRDSYNPLTGQYAGVERRSEEVFKSGLMVNNSLNIQPTKNFYLGLELGLGFNYINNEDYYHSDDEPLVQFNFKLGYRF